MNSITFSKMHAKQNGLVLSGVLEDGHLCEIAEVKDHPWMVGVQFHPEFKSKPTAPHPLFSDFIGAVLESKRNRVIVWDA